jgi:predicted MFS family arabinose efflux permease
MHQTGRKQTVRYQELTVSETTTEQATWGSLLAVREYRYLWLSYAISLAGDQLARVAIAVLVFTQTHSALLTSVVYAMTFLPWLVGGPLLGGFADRHPRRTVMMACHLLSALLVALLAIPGLPIFLLCAVLFVVILLESPFLSARAALLADVLTDDRYVLASALNNMTFQLAQVSGFVTGGALVAVIGARPALLADAATFLLSAALVRYAVRRRPAAHSPDGVERGMALWWRQMLAGIRLVFGDPWLRSLVMLAWLATFWVVPEGLAAPYASELHGSAVAVGLLLAAQPTGAGVGGLLLSRFVAPARRLEIMTPLAVLCCLPLLLFAAHPRLPVALAVLVLSGIGASYNLPANAAFVQAVPAEQRGQAFGLAAAGLAAGQGLGIALAGAIADHVGPALVIAVAGAAGAALALVVNLLNRRIPAMTPALH